MAQFGEYAGVTRQSVNSWEKGKAAPDWFSLENLKKNTSLNPEWVMLGSGEMFIDKNVAKIVELAKSQHFDVDAALDYLRYLSARPKAGNQ